MSDNAHTAHEEEDARTQFVLRLRPAHGCHHPVHAIKRVLKFALKRCHLRCVEAREEDVP
jgi:hypothetical protein